MTYTRAQIRDQIFQRCNLENTTAQTAAECNNYINDAAAYVHDFLIATWGERYARTGTSVSIVAGTTEYTIGAADFYKPVRVGFTINDISYPLRTFSAMDAISSTSRQAWDPNNLPRYSLNIRADGVNKIEFIPIPDAAATVDISYHPVAPVYSNDSDPVKIPHTDLLIIEGCIRMTQKDQRPTNEFKEERALIQKRIEDWVGTTDLGNVEQTLIFSRRRPPLLPDGRVF